MVAGIKAPVGQAWTHSPQATQVEAPIGASKSNTIFSRWPRPAMPITSLTCTSRQARTQRLHWMQASRLTAIATWLRSGFPELGIRIVRDLDFRLIGEQKLGDHFARGLGAVGLGLDLHAG